MTSIWFYKIKHQKIRKPDSFDYNSLTNSFRHIDNVNNRFFCLHQGMNKTIATETKSGKDHFSATDSLIDRYCNRKISSVITRVIAKTQITANQVTIFNVFVGIIALFYFQKGGYYNFIIGSVIYQLNTVFDHCDGEIARLKNQSSRLGFWLDIVTDAFVGSAIVIAIGLGLSKSLNNDAYITWGLLAGGGVAASSILVFYNTLKRDEKIDTICFSVSENGKPPTALETFIDNTLNKNLSFYILIGAIVGKLNFITLLKICQKYNLSPYFIHTYVLAYLSAVSHENSMAYD